MSYYRLYPSRNNTIFRYSLWSGAKIPTITGYSYENVNSGANPVMELMDGKGESKLVFGFEVPQTLAKKLQALPYTAKVQFWDAGTLWEPAINLQTLRLETFDHNFSEGDGYAFFLPEAKTGVSNWLNADSVTEWRNISFSTILDYEMNTINEDYNFEITTPMVNYIDNHFNKDELPVGDGLLLNLALSFPNRTDDPKSLFRKFIHSAYTKTVFKPYIEFFIEDAITDNSSLAYAGEVNKFYLVNKTGKEFIDKMEALVTMDGTDTRVESIIVTPSVVYIEVAPTVSSSTFKKEFIKIIWSNGNGKVYQQQLIEVKDPIQLYDAYDASNLFFYPASPSTHNVVKQGDILPMKVISEIRGQGPLVISTYEYRVTSADGFEMVPWSKVSVYREQMYFNLNTEFFYPEQQYEITIRNKTATYTLTSPQTHKFKVAMNDKSHMREMSSSPYYSRNQNFSK